jgi:hypothetical protein
MWADNEAELHAMARQLGMRREWFQTPPKASWRHYDISLTSKRQAIALGAVLTDRYGALEYRARMQGDTKTVQRIADIRNRKKKS